MPALSWHKVRASLNSSWAVRKRHWRLRVKRAPERVCAGLRGGCGAARRVVDMAALQQVGGRLIHLERAGQRASQHAPGFAASLSDYRLAWILCYTRAHPASQ